MPTMFTTARIPLTCTYDSDADAAYIYFEYPGGAILGLCPQV